MHERELQNLLRMALEAERLEHGAVVSRAAPARPVGRILPFVRSAALAVAASIGLALVVYLPSRDHPLFGLSRAPAHRSEELPWAVRACMLGDADCDGHIDSRDLEAFFLAIVNPDQFARQYPDCDPACGGDTNEDGVVNMFDIASFLTCVPG